jgi:hypothetical protein
VLFIVNLIRGALIGVAEVIPGVSGGTVALIVGLYRKLIDAIADVVLAGRRLVTGPRNEVAPLLRGLPWAMLIPVAIGMVTAVVLGARLIEPLLDTHPEQMRALFFGLVAAGIAVPLGILVRTQPGGVSVKDVVLIIVATIVAAVLTGLPPGDVSDPPLIVVFFAAAAAICALDTLRDRLPVSSGALREGLLTVALPGRFQVLPGRPVTVIDVAHNPHAARCLAQALAAMEIAGRTHAVFGMLRDKDVAGVVRELKSPVDHWHLAPLPGPRGASVEELQAALDAATVLDEVSGNESVAAAIAAARAIAALQSLVAE